MKALIQSLFLSTFCSVVLFLLQLPVSASSESKTPPLKVGFLCVGPTSDWGWNYAHNRGRLYLESKMKDKVQTYLVENVPEGADAERVMEKMIAQGNKLIFTTSYGYLEPALRVASRHPEVVIMQCQRESPPSAKNVGTYFIRQYELSYAAGVVAGRVSKTGRLGYIGGHPVPLLISTVNALTLGARSVNPKATVQVIWINSWSDPSMEAEATKGLVDSDVDVIASELDTSVNVVHTSEKNGVYSIGYGADLKSLAPKGWLTGQIWNWGPLYCKIARSVIDHTWKSANTIYSLKDGYSSLSPFGSAVPISVQKETDAVINQIKAGKLTVFKGPLTDRHGAVHGHLRLTAKQVFTDEDIAAMDWAVEGVKGSLPKGQ